jgi:DNA polymerase-3 subunit alpha
LNWFPLKNLTHYSLQKGFSKPEELAAKCKENAYPACGLCDYKTISGAVAFYQACKNSGIKPIIGCSFDGYILFSKNKNGWNDLIEIVSSIESDGSLSDDMLNKVLKGNNLIKLSDTPTASMPISYYKKQSDAIYHRILLCSEMKTTLPKIYKQIRKDKNNSINIDSSFPKEHYDKLNYFLSDKFYVLNSEESKGLDTKQLEEIYNQCEDYNILNKPMLPQFDCPRGLSEENYLKELCRVGWKKLLIQAGKVKDPDKKKLYADRFNEELNVIKGANLFGYFLIVQDIISYVNKQGWLSGPGRGSAAGCLISYLIGITQIDPIEYDLLFARFYNAGRNTADHISLPDIDMDVPGKRRDEVIAYLKNKYGHEHVSQMITFGRLQGRSAIKEVLRVNEACSFTEMNAITKNVPNESEISDQLADMEDEDRSIIRWALINRSQELQDFCSINEKGELEGQYAEYFKQAIEIEGTFKTQGKHAAGVVISAKPLQQVCPMSRQKDSDEKIAGLEMSDLEALGHIKFDILGITLLDKLMKIEELKNG